MSFANFTIFFFLLQNSEWAHMIVYNGETATESVTSMINNKQHEDW